MHTGKCAPTPTKTYPGMPICSLKQKHKCKCVLVYTQSYIDGKIPTLIESDKMKT